MDLPYELGTVIADKYHLATVIGDGGMGVVYGALDATGRWRAAVKVLRRGYAGDPRTVARFQQEALMSASLRSAHVVRIFEAGSTSEGLPYLAMEQLDGLDLDQLLQQQGPLTPAQAVRFVVQACNAIAEAHTQGIVHRDIKPSNLFLASLHDGSNIIKVLDFGVSKMRDAPVNVGLTRPGEFCGSPLYMAPEQATSARSVDARADIWSIGIVLYELMCGHNPVDCGNLMQTFGMLIKGTIPPLDEQVELPAGLGAVVHRCLQRSPAARYPTVAHLAMDLAAFARG